MADIRQADTKQDRVPRNLTSVLVGNTFPVTLIRRKCTITPIPPAKLASIVQEADFVESFWGHANTLAVASEKLGRDITPETERPVLTLSVVARLPKLRREYGTVYILNPDYAESYRPAIGEEVTQDKIIGWCALEVRFHD